MRRSEIVAAVGAPVGTVRKRLAALIAEGRVETNGLATNAGRYRRDGVDGERGVDGEGSASPAGSTAAVSAAGIMTAEYDSEPEPVDVDRQEPEETRPHMRVVSNPRLASQIEGVLERARGPVDSRSIARCLVVNLAEVAAELQAMVTLTEQGDRFPGVHRGADGRYSLLAGRRAA